ncbi:hypothetical protein AG0111_0g8664 [Alternaria gaisen]|uniref:Uncharacterized protein n=1 Tax=Alternaria gaisen TaxID=167740 RepID=A0ACB6FH95_9PLEO|nr:hypothetical protein AG0111_0g8664 [Alternaria gaisen]
MCEEHSYWYYKGKYDSVSLHYEGGIIVDREQYLKSTKESLLTSLKLSGKGPVDTRGESLFSKFNDMVCIFDMTCVIPASENDDPMAELIISDDYKKLLLAAAGQLLRTMGHRAPGTGKTFTAECIARKTNRPLLSMTTAELGTEEVQIQKRIAYYLDLASMWGAIVILDEAEVYLKQRKAGTFVHNALVSALLSAISVATKEATTDSRVAKEIKLTIDYVETVLSNRRRLREDVKAATEFYPEELAREGNVRGVEV